MRGGERKRKQENGGGREVMEERIWRGKEEARLTRVRNSSNAVVKISLENRVSRDLQFPYILPAYIHTSIIHTYIYTSMPKHVPR